MAPKKGKQPHARRGDTNGTANQPQIVHSSSDAEVEPSSGEFAKIGSKRRKQGDTPQAPYGKRIKVTTGSHEDDTTVDASSAPEVMSELQAIGKTINKAATNVTKVQKDVELLHDAVQVVKSEIISDVEGLFASYNVYETWTQVLKAYEKIDEMYIDVGNVEGKVDSFGDHIIKVRQEIEHLRGDNDVSISGVYGAVRGEITMLREQVEYLAAAVKAGRRPDVVAEGAADKGGSGDSGHQKVTTDKQHASDAADGDVAHEMQVVGGTDSEGTGGEGIGAGGEDEPDDHPMGDADGMNSQEVPESAQSSPEI